MAIKGVVFDWAGTTVDFGCFAPIHAFIEAFRREGVEPTMDETREPMGMLKIDHIRTMLEMERIKALWLEVHGRAATEEDVERIYASFEEVLFKDLDKYATPIAGVIDTVVALRAKGLKIGSTTGYTNEMMDVVRKCATEQGYNPDHLSTPTITGVGRPDPAMVIDNMKTLGLANKEEVVKVGDTVSDIKEGYNAGVWSIGIIKGSSELGLSEEESSTVSEEAKEVVRARYIAAGADFIIEQMSDLPQLIKTIDEKVAAGEKPNGYKL